MAGVLAQPGLVDHALRMLDAKTHGKGLGLHEYALTVQHAEGIAGTVAQRQNHMATADRFAIGQHHAFELAVGDQQIGHLAFEAHLAAEGDEDRKSTRLNSSHVKISYAVFCLKKKNEMQ